MSPLRCAKCNVECDKNLVCSKCKAINYCSKECQTEHWPIHRNICNEVRAVKILCDEEFELLNTSDEIRRLQDIRIPKAHPIFYKGEKCPVIDTCGIPLFIYGPKMHDKEWPIHRRYQLNQGNHAAVTFRIDLHDIHAYLPELWRHPPGTCILARRDYRPLTREAAEMMMIWGMRFFNASIEQPTSNGWAPTWQVLMPATFQLFSREYYEAQRDKGRPGFDEFFTPL